MRALDLRVNLCKILQVSHAWQYIVDVRCFMLFYVLLSISCLVDTRMILRIENSPETTDRIFDFQNGGLHVKAADILSRVCSSKLDEKPRMSL